MTTEEIFAALAAMKKKASLCVGGLLLLFAGVVIGGFCGLGPFIWVFFILLFVLGIYTAKIVKSYGAYYKENVVAGLLRETLENVTFEVNNGIPEETVRATGMMAHGNRYSSNDLITASYHGVGFVQSDVCIEQESTDSKGNTSTTTVFRGRWITLSFNKEFAYDLQVKSSSFSAASFTSRLFTRKEERRDRVKMENEAFNKEFQVYAQNEQEAFYILTPHLMESLLTLRTTLKAPLMLMFTGGVLHIAVYNNKDAFEPKIFGKLDPEEERARVLADISVITDFVDEMALDRDIYK